VEGEGGERFGELLVKEGLGYGFWLFDCLARAWEGLLDARRRSNGGIGHLNGCRWVGGVV
jgi:hypothetical protein